MHPRRNRRQRSEEVRCFRRNTASCDSNTSALRLILLLVIAAGIVDGFAVGRQGAALALQCHSFMRFAAHNRKRGGPLGGGLGQSRRFGVTKLSMAEEKNSYNTSERTNLAIEKLMTQHDPILLFASKLLPPDKAADASALYAWCRRLDEICDGEENNVLASSVAGSLEPVSDQLEVWQARFEALWSDQEPTTSANYPDNDDYLMDLALKSCIEKYQGEGNDANDSLLTRVPFDDMIQGMKSDAVEERRIQNMEELEVYAYQVAGTVGLMLLPLLLSDSKNGNNMTTRIATEEAREPAICLGKAIQLVNILRDATQDAKLGRIYLPQDMLRAEGVDDESIFAVGLDQSSSSQASTQPPKGYTTVVKKVSRRALELLAIAEKGKDTLPPPLGPLFVQIIVELYRDYLDELDCRGYDNLSSSSKCGDEDRVKISTLRKAKASLRAIVKVGRELFFGSGAVS